MIKPLKRYHFDSNYQTKDDNCTKHPLKKPFRHFTNNNKLIQLVYKEVKKIVLKS